MLGEVVKLDRKFPLVRLEDGSESRCEESATIKKTSDVRCVIGDQVDVELSEGHDFNIINEILPRMTSLIRKDPSDRSSSQVLAANFSQVVIIEPFDRLNLKRLVRELVLAHDTGAKVAIVLSKFDTVDEERRQTAISKVRAIAGRNVNVYEASITCPESIDRLIEELFADRTSILLGQSGAGKSTLINKLIGDEMQATGEVREGDGKGRHTTVSRSIIDLKPQTGRPCRIVDMPGVRGLGLWDSHIGIEGAFADIVEASLNCRFRDCTHSNEPGCAVKEAVKNGEISNERLATYIELKDEIEKTAERKKKASWKKK